MHASALTESETRYRLEGRRNQPWMSRGHGLFFSCILNLIAVRHPRTLHRVRFFEQLNNSSVYAFELLGADLSQASHELRGVDRPHLRERVHAILALERREEVERRVFLCGTGSERETPEDVAAEFPEDEDRALGGGIGLRRKRAPPDLLRMIGHIALRFSSCTQKRNNLFEHINTF